MKIAIDPGHGGHDTGAVGPGGLAEAPTVLTLSQALAALLEGFGYSILLTRQSDVFVNLGERCELANDWGATYFISIHANSNGPEAHGIETLYKTEKSQELAGAIHKSLIEATGERDRGLKHRGDLYVLNGTLMPATLLEIGFISHPATEHKLLEPGYLTFLADTIALGLKNYVKA